MAATVVCAACGAELRQNARFCHECGAPVASAHRAAEYKQVTVLFADVVHSMDIASAVGAERLRELMTVVFNRCRDVVRRYGGTVDKFTGDGVMALFGAPVALEDHAFRACLAALEIQRADVSQGDVALQLRVGLNSGEVVAGEIGLVPGSYTAIGAQVGMAQRMESVAPAGGVMLGDSTARLVEDRVVLAEAELVHIKGVAEPVRARRLLAVPSAHPQHGRCDPSLVGRGVEVAALTGMLDRAVRGTGCVVGVVGPAGIGKSRIAREVAALARDRAVEVFVAHCESHTSEVPFHALTALLHTVLGVTGLDGEAARARVRARLSDADPQDLLLLDDLLGIAAGDTELPAVDPDARRRRLTLLANTVSLARRTPAVYVIEDVHWIDEASETLLAGFLSVFGRTPSLVVLTYRPEYRGALTRIPDSQRIPLTPLTATQSTTLLTGLVGAHPSVAAVCRSVAERAAGNPFFVLEMVRDLAERGVLVGSRGNYVCAADAATSVPPTVQAAIAARIDRLGPAAKQTLNAAAVVGSRFTTELLAELGIDTAVDELVTAELIDQVTFDVGGEYAFHHPLTRVVAYESQLKSDRAVLHRRLAAIIEARDPAAADANAALIAEHLEAAGELHPAYGWHMRAGTWSTNRDLAAARVSWERARQIADALPADDPDRLAMRIAPRTLICGTGFRSGVPVAGPRFDELRALCATAGDKASLAVGMTGLLGDHMLRGQVQTASQVAAEHVVLIESADDPVLCIGLSFAPSIVKLEVGEAAKVLQWSQTVIDRAEGDATRGDFVVGSPLALAFACRGAARWGLGRAGWREDLSQSVTLARDADPLSYTLCVCWTFGVAIFAGVLACDAAVRREIDRAHSVAERTADDVVLGFAKYALSSALLHGDSAARERALGLLEQVRGMCEQGRFYCSELGSIDLCIAQALGMRGDAEQAIRLARRALDGIFAAGQLLYCVVGTRILVELLLDRGGRGDLAEARTAVDRLTAVALGRDYAPRDLTLLRLQAMLSRAHGDVPRYRDLTARYRKMAADLGFEGHMALAATMT